MSTKFVVGDHVRLSVLGICELMNSSSVSKKVYNDEGIVVAICDKEIDVAWKEMKKTIAHDQKEIEFIPSIKSHQPPTIDNCTMNITYTGTGTSSIFVNYYHIQQQQTNMLARLYGALKPPLPTDEQIVAAYEKAQRDNDGPRTGGPINQYLVVEGTQVTFAQARTAWSNVLRKKKEASKKAHQLSVQIDDASADDI
jgi:hypothetical protein